MDNSLPTYQQLLAASPRLAPSELEACSCCLADSGNATTHRCVGDQQRNNLQIRHKFSLVSADTYKFSILSSDTVAQSNHRKGEKYNNYLNKQVVGAAQVVPGAGTIKMDKTQQFADRVATQLRHDANGSALPSKVCQIEGCTKQASKSIGGGRCTFSIMSGLTKGCGRSFCSDHSGSTNEDDSDGDNDYFRANNYDEEYGPNALCPFDKSTDQSSSRSSFQSCDGDNEQPRLFNTQPSEQPKDATEKRPFEGQVCQECRPRLRRTYKISVAMFCGVPALVSLVCLAVLGGGQ